MAAHKTRGEQGWTRRSKAVVARAEQLLRPHTTCSWLQHLTMMRTITYLRASPSGGGAEAVVGGGAVAVAGAEALQRPPLKTTRTTPTATSLQQRRRLSARLI